MPMPVGMHPERVLSAQIVAAQGQHDALCALLQALEAIGRRN